MDTYERQIKRLNSEWFQNVPDPCAHLRDLPTDNVFKVLSISGGCEFHILDLRNICLLSGTDLEGVSLAQ